MYRAFALYNPQHWFRNRIFNVKRTLCVQYQTNKNVYLYLHSTDKMVRKKLNVDF